jgi:hypothetical protein
MLEFSLFSRKPLLHGFSHEDIFVRYAYVIKVTFVGKRADHSGPLEHWDHGFESHSRHGCLCAFILC